MLLYAKQCNWPYVIAVITPLVALLRSFLLSIDHHWVVLLLVALSYLILSLHRVLSYLMMFHHLILYFVVRLIYAGAGAAGQAEAIPGKTC